jgi:hypothetical protein
MRKNATVQLAKRAQLIIVQLVRKRPAETAFATAKKPLALALKIAREWGFQFLF